MVLKESKANLNHHYFAGDSLKIVRISKIRRIDKIRLSPNINLSLNTLADLSQIFSILSDLKCYRSAFSSSTNHLGNAKPKEQP